MKAVEMFADYDYQPHPRMTVRFHAGVTYTRVLETAAREIARAEAGRIISLPLTPGSAAGHTVDASHAWRRKR